jgi:hypothetical protein
MPTDPLKALLALRNVDAPRTFLAADQLPPDAEHPLVRLQLTDDTADNVMAIVKLFLNRINKANAEGNMVSKEYDPAAYTAEYQVDVLPVSTDVKLSSALAPFSAETDVRAYKPSADALRPFKCVAITIRATANAKPIVLFKKQTQPSELRSDRKVRIFSAKGVFDTLDDASFLIDDDFDLAYVEDVLLIFDKEKFHVMFGYYGGLQQFAQSAMPGLKAAVPMQNFADFEKACLADKTLMKRLRRTIGALPPKFDMARVAKAIAEQSIPVTLAGTKKNPLLVFDKAKKHDFFTLLEDGFLRSSYTDRFYEVNSKRTRQV